MSAVDHPELPLARRADESPVSMAIIKQQTCMSRAIALCVSASGLDDKEVYLSLGIDAGHWSRITKGDAHFPVNKLCALMDLCGNEAPLMWLANSRGKGLVLLKSEAERRAEVAEQERDAERAKVAMLTEILAGRRAA